MKHLYPIFVLFFISTASADWACDGTYSKMANQAIINNKLYKEMRIQEETFPNVLLAEYRTMANSTVSHYKAIQAVEESFESHSEKSNVCDFASMKISEKNPAYLLSWIHQVTYDRKGKVIKKSSDIDQDITQPSHVNEKTLEWMRVQHNDNEIVVTSICHYQCWENN